jgi:small subunit ribosomal protein S1
MDNFLDNESTEETIEKDSVTGESMAELMDLYEESFKRFAEGEVVNGKIISVDKDHVLVDIGYKSEGQIRIREFEVDGEVTAQVGDTVEVMVEWWDDENEVVVLSKEKAEKVKVWDDIKNRHEADDTITGTITNRVKGGFLRGYRCSGIPSRIPGGSSTHSQPG